MKIQSKIAICEASDLDLLLLIACKEDDEEEAELAFTEFYKRYSDFVRQVSQNACRNFNSYNAIAMDVHNNVMYRVYEKAITFTDDGITDPAKLKIRIKGWLSRIVFNEVKELLRKDADIKLRLLGDKMVFPPSKHHHTNTPEINKIHKALKELNERERDVLLTYFMFEHEGKYTRRDIINELCERYQTTPENIRQIKKRAFDKLKEYCK